MSEGREYIKPTLKERLELCISHVHAIREHKGEHVGAAEIKKHAALYIKGIRGAASVRDSIMKAESTEEIERLVLSLCE